jgi:hypothetical protein
MERKCGARGEWSDQIPIEAGWYVVRPKGKPNLYGMIVLETGKTCGMLLCASREQRGQECVPVKYQDLEWNTCWNRE